MAPGDTVAPWVADRQAELDERIAEIKVPTLLLWASDDEISPAPIGQRLNELLPNSEPLVYPSDDHWVVHQFANDVAERIARHLDLR